MHKRFLSFILACALFHQYAWAQIEQVKDQPNCNISTPPNESGESSAHALLIKIYPRKSAVAKNYTGCQTMWLQSEPGWQKFSVQYFQDGKLSLWWSPIGAHPSTGMLCKFKAGKLAENQSRECYVPADKGLSPSFAPGCFQKVLKGDRMNEACEKSLDDEK